MCPLGAAECLNVPFLNAAVEGIYEHTHAHAQTQTVVITAAPDMASLPSLISKVHPLFSIT